MRITNLDAYVDAAVDRLRGAGVPIQDDKEDTVSERTQTVLALTAEQADRFKELQARWADKADMKRGEKRKQQPSILIDMMLDALEKDQPDE